MQNSWLLFRVNKQQKNSFVVNFNNNIEEI